MDATQQARLVEKFAKAGLRIRVRDRPIVSSRGAEDVFQMDIAERNTRKETFELWPGKDSSATVTDVDPRRRQVMMLVTEPRRRFQDTVWLQSKAGTEERKKELARLSEQPRSAAQGRVLRIVSQNDQGALVDFETPNVARHLLVGHDERHYFIANVPATEIAPNTVEQAHRALKPYRLRRQRVKRQGEWFFVPLSDDELRGVRARVKAEPWCLHPHYGIFEYDPRRQDTRGHLTTDQGKPRISPPAGGDHIVTELYWDPSYAGGAVFVRGAVRHGRHATLRLMEWHRVERNLELAAPFGVRWVD